jgi:hypothetical protein
MGFNRIYNGFKQLWRDCLIGGRLEFQKNELIEERDEKFLL